MSTGEEWDVEQYKMEHECDEHWELRRRFLIAHKDKFPEDELICLAQVFTNVEFLGCRYPEETMQLVATLSQEVAEDYREKQKTKLQRTFVKASDAASAKAKGLRGPSCDAGGSQTSESMRKRSLSPPVSDVPVKTMKREDVPYGNLVLVEYENDSPQIIITRAAAAVGSQMEWKYDTNAIGTTCKVILDTKVLAESSGTNRKIAQKEASAVALCELQKYYYTIKVKRISDRATDNVVSTDTSPATPAKEERLADDNIGSKLMKLMGWSGGGLGKAQQGISEPVTVKKQLSRQGLGLKGPTSNLDPLKKKCRDVLRDYMNGDMRTDLVFSTDFTNEERALIHSMARTRGLKSKSIGPKDKRCLVISRKVDPWELVTELKNLGGCTEKYELVDPVGTK